MKELEDKVREFTENLPTSISETIPLPSPAQPIPLPPLADFDLDIPLQNLDEIEPEPVETGQTVATDSLAATCATSEDVASIPSCSWETPIGESNTGAMSAQQQALAQSVLPSDLGKTICEYCQKDFVYPARLLRHRRIHTGERPYKCEFCPKCFTQKIHLKLHTRTHTGEKPFKCSQCPYAASDMSSLKKHASKHAPKAPVVNQQGNDGIGK